MENKVSYILIGLFVFILTVATIGFILWLGKYVQSDVYRYYKVVTKESVSGLNLKAPVKVRGVSVGEVKDISINSENSEEVEVLIRVKEGTPIKEDTYALIELQGITGLSYIQLQGGLNKSALLKTGKTNESYGVIPSHPSIFSRVDQTIGDIGEKTKHLLDKTDVVMNEKNLENFAKILSNLEKITSSLNTTLETISSKEDDFNNMMVRINEFEISAIDAANEVKKMSLNMSDAVNNMGIDTMNSMREASATVTRVMGHLDEKIKSGTFDIDSLLRENLLPFQNTLEDFRTLILTTQESIDGLAQSPSDLLFKETQIAPAPSEENQK
jgi:phospholipid/cholesterol/gamma-HCH transport system substrate-binding protein